MDKITQILHISKNFFSESPNFYDKFQQVVKNIEGFFFFPTFISSM
jgi:hypothetical protein